MKGQLQRSSNSMSISSFWEGHLLEKYNFNPPYQRNSVWSDEKKSFFIDSVMRNYPVPPIFLHQKIDNVSGSSKFDVVDGKQRLQSLISFIEGVLPCSSDSFNDDEGISGLLFEDFNDPRFSDYKAHFWRYSLPVEYIDTVNKDIVDGIFDRLNRNGEKLNGQELRNARYYSTRLMAFVRERAGRAFWSKRLDVVDRARMEDIEFISEITFVLLENQPLHGDQGSIDQFYDKHKTLTANAGTDQLFDSVTALIERWAIDYEMHKIEGVSHLYGIWCFAHHCILKNCATANIGQQLATFFTELRQKKKVGPVQSYSDSMSSRTKDRGQRIKRADALCNYCGVGPYFART